MQATRTTGSSNVSCTHAAIPCWHLRFDQPKVESDDGCSLFLAAAASICSGIQVQRSSTVLDMSRDQGVQGSSVPSGMDHTHFGKRKLGLKGSS